MTPPSLRRSRPDCGPTIAAIVKAEYEDVKKSAYSKFHAVDATDKLEGMMNRAEPFLLAIGLVTCLAASSARPEKPEEWIALGTRVHGFA